MELDEEKALLRDSDIQKYQVSRHRGKQRFWFFVQLVLYASTFSLLTRYITTWPSGWPAQNEAFELRLPVLYKNLVYEQDFLEHTFGNSWGQPAIAEFTPPQNVAFNRVVLELNTTVDGVQYDRLAHVFVNDIPVWRTSTAEPGNKRVFSSVNKDVSKYTTLFQPNSTVTLQLDNLLNGRLTGSFATKLRAKYYNEEEDNDYDSVFRHFKTTSRPAEKVIQLIKPKPNRTPLQYYPADKLELSIPKISQNTTTLKLALYVSGNAEEEFWYSNVVDTKKDIFVDHGHRFAGHGPVRVVNTYINNVLVSVNAPEPVIFTGGISPALWRPIVGVNAFDIRPLEIDLTAYLPELWKNPAALDIEVTNGTLGGTVGSNWIVAANLLSWESDEIKSSSGTVESFTNSSKFDSFLIQTDEDKYFEIVVSGHSASIQSNMTFVLNNGTEVPLKVHCNSNVKYSNGQQYYLYGDAQFLSSAISSTHDTAFYKDGEMVGSVKASHVYPLSLALLTEPINPPDIKYQVNITNVYGSRILASDKEIFVLESYQNGTSEYNLTPKGNHGTGTTEQTFAAEIYPPFGTFKEDAFAKAIDGVLVEFDEKLHFDSNSLVIPTELLDPEDHVVSHIQEMVLDGDLSLDAGIQFLLDMKSGKEQVLSRATEIREARAYYDEGFQVSHAPGFRMSLE